MRSSRTISAASSSMRVRRSSPYNFFTSSSSLMMTLRSLFSEPRMDSYSAMLLRTSANSFEISSMESLVRRCNCSSRMASACFAVKGFSGSSLGARPAVLSSIFLQPQYAIKLSRGGLEELVEDDLGLGAALEFDHDAHAVTIALITNVGDVFDVFVVDQLRDALDQARLVHLVRNFRNDDGVAVPVKTFDRGFGAHLEAAAAGAVGFENSSASVNDA